MHIRDKSRCRGAGTTHTFQIRGNFCAGAQLHLADATRRDAWRLLRIQAARCIRGTLVFAVSIRISRRDVFRGIHNANLKGSAPPPRHCMWTAGMITCRLCRPRCRVIAFVTAHRTRTFQHCVTHYLTRAGLNEAIASH